MADLTDAELDEIALCESVDMIRTPGRISAMAFDMVQEIRRRRAADLSGGDRAGLRAILEDIGAFWEGRDLGPKMQRGVQVLRRLIGDKP